MFKKCLTLHNLLERARSIISGGLVASAHEILEVSAHLKFFPAQRNLRKQLVGLAYAKLSRDNHADFGTYFTLYRQALELYIFDKEYNPRIARFAARQMQRLSTKASKYSRKTEQCLKDLRRAGVAIA